MIKRNKVFAGIMVAAMIVNMTGCSGSSSDDKDSKGKQKVEEKVDSDFKVSYDGIKTASLDVGLSVHDPSIFEEDGTYYIYGSHMATAKSEDLRNWTMVADGYGKNSVYGDLMFREEPFEYSGNLNSLIPTDDSNCHVWAPDVIYNKEQKLYFMYFCTSSTWNASNL